MTMKFCPTSGKISYESMLEAQKVIGSSRDRGYAKIPLKVYRCDKCGDYHLTSQTAPRKPKKRPF